jgi:hypothetical protein
MTPACQFFKCWCPKVFKDDRIREFRPSCSRLVFHASLFAFSVPAIYDLQLFAAMQTKNRQQMNAKDVIQRVPYLLET